MSIEVRDGTQSDMDDILRIYGEKRIFLSMIWGSREADVRRVHRENLMARKNMIGQSPELRIYVAGAAGQAAPAGYMITVLNMTEATTGERQGLLFDYGVAPEHDEKAVFSAMLIEAEKALRAQGLRYLIADVYLEDMQGMALMEESGFARELNRVVKKVENRVITPREMDPFTVRKAENTDRYFITWLNSEFTSLTMLGGREKEEVDIQCRFLEIYSALNIEESRDFSSLIIEDSLRDEPIGYMMLKLGSIDQVTGAWLGYVYDMAIQQEYWKTRAALRLMKETENLLMAKGIDFFLGDISEKNQRALKGAVRLIGFTHERLRWMKKI